MDRVAFEIFGFPIMWYGIIISTAMMLCILLSYYEVKKMGDDPEIIIDIALWCIPAAIIGARAYYVIFEWDYYSMHLDKILNIREGGMAIHGGVIAAVAVGYIFAKVKKVDFTKYLDIAGMVLPLGQAIGRWGNFFNGEAHGGPTDLPWGIMIDGVKVHPTFLYESLWNIGLFIFLYWYSKRKRFNGEIFLIYGIGYSIARFFIEGMRTDSLMFMGMRQAQLISAGIIIVFAGIYVYMLKKVKKA